MPDLAAAARAFALTIWADIVDDEAREAAIEQTAAVLIQQVTSIRHDWEGHDKIDYVDANRKHKRYRRPK